MRQLGALETVQFMKDAAVLVRLFSVERQRLRREENALKARGITLKGCNSFLTNEELL